MLRFSMLLVLSLALNMAAPAPCMAKALSSKASMAEVMVEVAPYLLPADHKLSAALDQIFTRKGVLTSIQSLEEAGFKILVYRQGRGLILASHPLLGNFLIKTYLDGEKHVEWTRWLRRVKGRDRVQGFLDDNPEYSAFLKVPIKWIYKIPPEAVGRVEGEGVAREFILLVEDMELVDKYTNIHMYKHCFSYQALDALYLIIEQTGYSDGHIANLPFSIDQRIAFIDTEYTNTWPVHPEWLTKWFSRRKQVYWQLLIQNKGPAALLSQR
jgi:hypothetical protein